MASAPIPMPSERRHTVSVSSGSEGQGSSGYPLTRTLSDPPRNFVSPLHQHLYDSGLRQSELSDVKIAAHGRLYRLHRLVLAQSDFFRSLLAGGFSEQALTDPASRSVPIPIQFDASCSRAAFEYCIARIYGGGPELLPPSTSRPDAARGYPLTEAFARQAASSRPVEEHFDPNEVQVATPAFLLSLLATALYLELSPIVAETLQLIFRSITPYTVATYLRFALGEGVPGPLSDEPCAGLGTISVPDPAADTASSPTGAAYFYGEHAERIGDACACWMARWGSDILPVEAAQSDSASPAIRLFSWHGVGGISSEWLRVLLSSDALFIDRGRTLVEVGTSSELARYEMAKTAVELRRRQKSAYSANDDTLHETGTASEGDIVESLGDDDEREYERLFSEGIYLSQLPFATLQELMHDHSPTNGQPYVPSAVLFRAHWDQSRLRSLFPLLPPGGNYIEDADKTRASLGISIPCNEAPPTKNAITPSSARRWIVPIDETVRINDNSQPMQGLGSSNEFVSVSPPAFDPPLGTSPPGKPVVRSKHGAWQPANRYFGLANAMTTSSVFSSPELKGLAHRQYVSFEPFRFSIEFWDIDQLREKQRLYSHTVSYAGSAFNVYLQVLRKSRGKVQLGIYLHRQSPAAAIPAASKPPHFSAAEIASNPVRSGAEGNDDRDPRSNVKIFFSLICPGLAGVSSTRFASAPDSFSLSQSWGWKSQSLMANEYILNSPDSSSSNKNDYRRASRYVSLRCSVVMGVV